MRVLNLVEHACDAAVPVTLVGQGLGPLDDPGLQARAAQVLPKDRAGVDAERVLVTGDDAIELAYHARIHEIGSYIGFFLRVAGYAPVSARMADLIGRAVCSAAAEGLALFRLDGACLEQTLAVAIDREWRTALVVREPLCAPARVQIDASWAPFDRVATLTQGRATARSALPRDHLPSAADPA